MSLHVGSRTHISIRDALLAFQRNDELFYAVFRPTPAGIRYIERGGNHFRIIRDANAAARARFEGVVGPGTHARAVRDIDRFSGGRQHAEAYVELCHENILRYRSADGPEVVVQLPNFIMTYEQLIYLKGPNGVYHLLGRMFEADHFIENRISRTILDGIDGAHVRSIYGRGQTYARQIELERGIGNGFLERKDPMRQAMAAMMPANAISMASLSEHLPAALGSAGRHGFSIVPWSYIHQGLESKTNRMRQYIPWHLEGMYTYQEQLSITLHVVCVDSGMGVPARYDRAVREMIRADYVSNIEDAIEDLDDQYLFDSVAEFILGETGQRVSAPDHPNFRRALTDALSIEPMTADQLKNWRYHAAPYGPKDMDQAIRDEHEAMASAVTEIEEGPDPSAPE